jgi:hypothetical protein
MSQYTLESRNFPALPGSHRGTGAFSDADNAVDPASVTRDVGSPLKFKYVPYSIVVMSVEIDTPNTPNWFAVSFRQGITVFDTVNIFCHPYPGSRRADMQDADYPSRSGNWPKLFRYAETFGRQIGMAKTNHITIMPCFSNASYGSTGIFGPNWKDMVEQILALARAGASTPPPTSGARSACTPIERIHYASASGKKGAPSAAPTPGAGGGSLRNVVLSNFSHGRVLMGSVRTYSPGLSHFLREIWDFDGVHAPTPHGGVRALIYTQSNSSSSDMTTFPVPPTRWQEYHHKILTTEENHGDIPARLAYHAATISQVGK